jgi:hypothetical protein
MVRFSRVLATLAGVAVVVETRRTAMVRVAVWVLEALSFMRERWPVPESSRRTAGREVLARTALLVALEAVLEEVPAPV